MSGNHAETGVKTMEDSLRHDLMVIILEEAFSMRPEYARRVALGKAGIQAFRKADVDARDCAENILQRLESRCSTIEG